MKKLLLVFALTGLLTACNNKKEDKQPEEKTNGTTTTEPATNNTDATDPAPTSVNAASGVPNFSDPEVQKFANDYAAFIDEYKKVLADPASPRSAEFAMKWSDWASRSMSVGMKLAANPAESKKWTDWVESVNSKIRDITK